LIFATSRFFATEPSASKITPLSGKK